MAWVLLRMSWALRAQGHTEVVKRLLYFSNKDSSDLPKLHLRTTIKGETALMAAAKCGHAECVTELAAAGSNVNQAVENIACQSRLTALHMAASKVRPRLPLAL